MSQIKILNVVINNLSQIEILEQLEQDEGVILTPNVDHLMI